METPYPEHAQQGSLIRPEQLQYRRAQSAWFCLSFKPLDTPARFSTPGHHPRWHMHPQNHQINVSNLIAGITSRTRHCRRLGLYVAHSLAKVSTTTIFKARHVLRAHLPKLHSTMVKKEDLADKELLPFTTAQDFEDFLEREHQKTPEVYVKLAKKASGIPSITQAEAVEVALCFGWIDGSGCGIDETWWTTRFLPRRPKSMWSKKNVDTVGRLIEQGRLRPAGQAVVDAAKQDGRWDRAYAGPATITEPEDFNIALAADPAAKKVYSTLNKTERYSVLWKIETASPAARAKRVQTLVQMLAEGKKPPRPGAKASSGAEDVVSSVGTGSSAGPNKVVKSTKRKNSNSGQISSTKKAVVKPSSTVKAETEIRPSHPRRSGLRARS